MSSDRTLVEAAPKGRLDLAVLEKVALAATRDAAVACQPFVGRGDKHAADAAATETMRRALPESPGLRTVVIGEGEKDGAPMLHNGERVGVGGPAFDIAVDPLECTPFCAKGLPGSFVTVAFAEGDALLRPGPSHYMEKLVVPPAARGAIDIADSPELRLARVAGALGKAIAELRVVVLDKPRHSDLIVGLRRAGASVTTPPTAGALDARRWSTCCRRARGRWWPSRSPPPGGRADAGVSLFAARGPHVVRAPIQGVAGASTRRLRLRLRRAPLQEGRRRGPRRG